MTPPPIDRHPSFTVRPEGPEVVPGRPTPEEAQVVPPGLYRPNGALLEAVGIPADLRAKMEAADSADFEKTRDEVAIADAADLTPPEYDRQREAIAEGRGMRVTTLDKLVNQRRADLEANAQAEAEAVLHEERRAAAEAAARAQGSEAASHVIVIADTLEAARGFITRHVVVNTHQADALALWALHTHAIEAFDTTPYLMIGSPEKRCGKSRLLDVLKLLVRAPWKTGRTSTAVLPRKIETDFPTLLLDESDAAFKGDKEYAETLRGVLNEGFQRGGCASLCVGKDHEPHDFSVFCPKAIAGIGRLPDTVADRSIPITLKRKGPKQKVNRFRVKRAEPEARSMRAELSAWARANVASMRTRVDAFTTEAPCIDSGSVSDRAEDVWEPLIALADAASEGWGKRARSAAIALSGDGVERDDSLGVRLLADIKAAFDGRPKKTDDAEDEPPCEKIQEAACGDVIASKDLVHFLTTIEASPWGPYKGQPFNEQRLAHLLSPYDNGLGRRIASKLVRVGDGGKVRITGYAKAWFKDAWDRYLATPLSGDLKVVTSVTNLTGQGFAADSDPMTGAPCHDPEKSRKALSDKACHACHDLEVSDTDLAKKTEVCEAQNAPDDDPRRDTGSPAEEPPKPPEPTEPFDLMGHARRALRQTTIAPSRLEQPVDDESQRAFTDYFNGRNL